MINLLIDFAIMFCACCEIVCLSHIELRFLLPRTPRPSNIGPINWGVSNCKVSETFDCSTCFRTFPIINVVICHELSLELPLLFEYFILMWYLWDESAPHISWMKFESISSRRSSAHIINVTHQQFFIGYQTFFILSGYLFLKENHLL